MTAVSVASSAARRTRPVLVYLLAVFVGAGAFLYPFWIPSTSLPNAAHAGDAPLVAAIVGLLVVVAIALEVRRGTMNGATVALLGVLAAVAGLLRLLALPGGGNGIFFLIVLAGAAFGPRFGMLLGLCAMAVSAVITGGIGPWLPFQMLALAWMGGLAGLLGNVTSRLPPEGGGGRARGVRLGVGFPLGAVMNLWFWPFARDGGPLSWDPSLGLAQTLHHYWSFYVASSLAWDAASALTNAALILLTGLVLMRTFRRFAHRLDPVVELLPLERPRTPTQI